MTDFVSRGGDKLQSALNQFKYSPQDQIALDVGAATGGFTDCLLQNGARFVFTVDVSYGQLAWKLRQDSRVQVQERFNARYLLPSTLKAWNHPFTEQIDLVVMDVSFISILKIIPSLKKSLKPGFTLLSLVKPQFEARREWVGEGGVITDSTIHEKVNQEIKLTLEKWDFQNVQLCKSEITGADGNQEFFVWAQTPK
jgi:23S rRNA (cytidine1920-2'-O)/16S rRNA (cytidine1409-2'-O)-methyltransferase